MSDTLTDSLREQVSSLSASPPLAETLHIFLEGQPAFEEGQEPWTIFVPWLTGHQASALSERLGTLKDDQPLPGALNWTPPPSEASLDAQLSSADRRTVKVFRELLKQERKSSKYLHEFKAVFDRHSHNPRLARMILSYLLRWEGPESAHAFARQQLALHPDWNILRFAWASQVMFRSNPRRPDPEQLKLLPEILEHKLTLEEHLADPAQPVESDTALLFYQATGFYYLLERRFERAAFAINQAAALDPDNPLLLVLLMAFTALMVQDPERARQLRDFLLPLMANK